MFGRTSTPSALADAALGAASGLAGTWVMSLVHRPIMRTGSEQTKRREKEAQGDMPPPLIRAAESAASVAGTSLPPDKKKPAAKVVHYGYGMLWGVAFALGARYVEERFRRYPLAAGLAFGATLWALSDEVLVPLFHFSHPPTRYPASTHAKGFAVHLVYGAATEASWRAMRAAAR